MVAVSPALQRTHDLASLAALDIRALGALYAAARPPTRVDALEGDPRGRMLAIRALDRGMPAALVRRLSGSSSFPWDGKTFYGRGAIGTGINRISLAGRHKLFPFRTSIRPSAIDRAPCIVLDYDLKDNPAAIRAIHDELREIEPGLFLGPAMLKTRAKPELVLWFALDTTVQSPAMT